MTEDVKAIGFKHLNRRATVFTINLNIAVVKTNGTKLLFKHKNEFGVDVGFNLPRKLGGLCFFIGRNV